MRKTRRHNKRKIRTRKNRIKGGDCWKDISNIKNETLDKAKYIDFYNTKTGNKTYGWFESLVGNKLMYRSVNDNENPCIESGAIKTIDVVSIGGEYKYRISKKIKKGFFSSNKDCTTMPITANPSDCFNEPIIKQSLNGNANNKVQKKIPQSLLSSGLVGIKPIEMENQRKRAIEEQARQQAIKAAVLKAKKGSNYLDA